MIHKAFDARSVNLTESLSSALSWPAPLADLDAESRVLALALSISIIAHGIILSIQFKLPEYGRKFLPSQLEVVLVNSKSRTKPTDPDVYAQASLDAGGDTDLNRRAKSPLPVVQAVERGTDLERAQRRIQELETQQQQLLSQARPRERGAQAEQKLQSESKALLSGTELSESAVLIARMEAQIARQ